MTSFDNAIVLEDQPVYQDVPEFSLLSDSISNTLLSINNSLNSLSKNIDFFQHNIVISNKPQSKKYHDHSIKLIDRLVEQFKILSSDNKKINSLQGSILNKSQLFVRQKLNDSINESLSQFNSLQNQFKNLDKDPTDLLEIDDANHGVDSDNNNGRNNNTIQIQIEHTPVNAELIEQQELLANERETEINRISNSVSELNEIFHDLSNLVSSQGEMVDNIESNIYTTLNHTRNADRSLRRADYWDRKRRNFCGWLWLVSIVVLIIVILIILA